MRLEHLLEAVEMKGSKRLKMRRIVKVRLGRRRVITVMVRRHCTRGEEKP